jgi:hypothetical protein
VTIISPNTRHRLVISTGTGMIFFWICAFCNLYYDGGVQVMGLVSQHQGAAWRRLHVRYSPVERQTSSRRVNCTPGTYCNSDKQSRRVHPRSSSSSRSSALHMVLTTPENIIEEASTQKLLDDLIDESTRVSARRPIIMQFDPTAIRIWRRWRGTVFSETWPTAVKNVIYASVITKLLYSYKTPAKLYLEGFNILWGQLLSVTTFTLTFFLNQSYSLWRKCYAHSRRLQGRMNDLGLTLAAHAARTNPSDPEVPSTYTQPARQALELVARYVRLFNIITYASFTLSHRPILTPRGMRRLQERGLMTAKEREVLSNAKVAATQRHNAILMWITRIFIEARMAGHLDGGAGFENQFVEKIHVIRAQYGAIGDELQARMPLAYAHIVQVLVDVILWMYPITAFASGINPVLSVLGTGLMTVFYQGLFDLAKQFLDPYDNENYGKGDDPLCVDTLVAETNSGSLRWLNGFEQQPFNSERLREGELYDGLPARGYSVEELVEREAVADEARKQEQQKKRQQEEKQKEKQKKVQSLIDSGYLKTDVSVIDDTETIVDAITAFESAGVRARDETVLAVNGKDDTLKRRSANVTITTASASTLFGVKKNATSTATAGVADGAISKATVQNETRTEDTISDQTGPFVEGISTATIQADENTVLANTNSLISTILPMATANMTELSSSTIDAVRAVNDTYAVAAATTTAGHESTRDEFPLDIDLFQGFEWFDRVEEDGNEYRLGNMLADEVWENDYSDVFYDEENDDLASPLTTLNKDRPWRDKNTPATPDQTQWDGVSQLWGAPLSLRKSSKSESSQSSSSLKYDDSSFDNVYQLFGGVSSDPELLERSEGDSAKGADRSYEGIAQLWSGGVGGGRGSGDENSSNNGVGEWFEEVGPDGQEYRLSQMLADEEFEDDSMFEEESRPLTVEEFKEQAIEFVKMTAEEMYETEAIMNAPPAADSILEIEERKEQLELLAKQEEELKLLQESASNQTSSNSGYYNNSLLDVLEMDSSLDAPQKAMNVNASYSDVDKEDNTAIDSEFVADSSPQDQAELEIAAEDGDDRTQGSGVLEDEESGVPPVVEAGGISMLNQTLVDLKKDLNDDDTLHSNNVTSQN